MQQPWLVSFGLLSCFAGQVSPTLCAQSPVAQSRLFFVEYAYQRPRLQVMGENGQSPRALLRIPPAFWVPLDLNFDAATDDLLWCDAAGPYRILRAGRSGTGISTVLTTNGPVRGPGFDGLGRLYYTDGNTLCRANGNGSGRQVLFTGQQQYPLGCPLVDATNGHVYVGADGAILRFDLGGGNAKTVVTGLGFARALGLDIGRGHIYWIDTQPATDHVARARLDDTEHTVLIDNTPAVSQSPGLLHLIVDPVDQAIYYAEELWFDHIVKATLDGANPVPIYASPLGLSPSGLVLDRGQIVQPIADCNRNGIADAQDLALGTSFDCNGNGHPDECEVAPCPQRTFFIDYGSNPAVPSRGVGCAAIAQNTCFEAFQPFDVPAPGVALGSIGLDGWTSNYALGEGVDVNLFRDDGSGAFPDESVVLAATLVQFRFDPDRTNWVYAPLQVALLPGRYWLRLTANEPAYYAGVNVGTVSALQTKSRNGLGTWFQSAASSLALRLVTAPLAASSATVSLAAGGQADFVLDAGPQHAQEMFWMLGSITGTSPGLPLGPLVLPLQADPYLMFLAQNPNTQPLANGFGLLDVAGKATARFDLPANVPAGLLGLQLHHAYLTLSPFNVPQFVSNAVTFVLGP